MRVDYLGRATEGHLARRLAGTPAPLPAGASTAGSPVLDVSTLVLRYARVSADGALASRRLGYVVELEAGLGSLSLLQYRLQAVLGSTTINVGQMRVPFSYNWAINESRLVFPERSIATEQFRYDYDIGVSLETPVYHDRVSLIVGGFNGGGSVLGHNDNLDPMLAVRLEARSRDGAGAPRAEGAADERAPAALVVGASVLANYVPAPPSYGYLSGTPQAPRQLVLDSNGDGLPDGITTLDAELDVKLTRRGFSLEAEGYFRHEWWHDIPAAQPVTPTAFAPRRDFWGAFAQAIQSFPKQRIKLGARLAVTDLSPLSPGWQRYETHSCVATGGQLYACALPYASRRLEASGVLVYSLVPRTLQLEAMYSFLRWSSASGAAPPDPREHRAIAAIQLSF